MQKWKLFSTVPGKESDFWQVVFLPTITILRSTVPNDKYTVISFEWLFWSLALMLEQKSKRNAKTN